MVIDTLTDIEKKKDIQKDRIDIVYFFDSLIERPDYRRRVKKATRFPFTYIASFKSKRGNRYKIIITITNKKRGLTDPFLSVYTSLSSKDGTYILRYDWVQNTVSIFTPHFFRRYRERFLKNEALTSDEVRETFLIRNQNLASSNKDMGEDIGTCNDGYVYIRRKDKETNVCVTFVTPDMLTDEQLEYREKLLEVIKERDERDSLI